MHLTQLVEDFLWYMKVENNASDYTLGAYKGDLKLLANYLISRGMGLDVPSITTPTIRNSL